MLDLPALDAELASWRAEKAARARARSRIAQSVPRQRYWAARSHPKTFAAKLRACGATGRACTCCGAAVLRYCHARLVCKDCGDRAWKRARRRIAAGLDARHQEALTRWRAAGRVSGQEPRIALVTLTMRHSGDVTADRKLFSKAWHRWRAWYRETYGVNLAYAWTPEYTPGTDGKGHVHLHVVTMLPWVDLDAFRASWTRATGGQGTRIHVSAKTRGVRAAAKYVAKYATKGVFLMDVEHQAHWVRAQDGMRSVSTSRGFYFADPATARCPVTLEAHQWPREWMDVAGFTPSHPPATTPRAGPPGGVTSPFDAGTGPVVHSGPAQLQLQLPPRCNDCPF